MPRVKKESAPKRAPARSQKLRFTYKEQREFDTIDADLAALEAQISQCDAEIAAASSDYIRLQTLMEQKEQLTQALEEKTERWVYLNELAERIAAQK